jgi:hypothetical protein
MEPEENRRFVRMLCRTRSCAAEVRERYAGRVTWRNTSTRTVFVRVADVDEVTTWADAESLITRHVYKGVRKRAAEG